MKIDDELRDLIRVVVMSEIEAHFERAEHEIREQLKKEENDLYGFPSEKMEWVN